MSSQQEINARIEQLAKTMREKRLVFSDSQALERARDIVMQEVKMQSAFESMKDDPAKNPQQRVQHVSAQALKEAGMLTGTELPANVPLSELLKGRKEKQ